MSFWQKRQSNNKKINNSRVNLIIAIIFLLAGMIIYKLIDLQILNYDLYYNLASDQHQIYNLLNPTRGRIFIQNDVKSADNQLYPIATNKNFALLFAVPKDIKETEKISEQLYIIFKKEKTEKEVERIFKKEDNENLKVQLEALGDIKDQAGKLKEAEVIAGHKALLADKMFQDLRQVRRETEINLRKKVIIDAYLKKLDKPGDIYEPLEQKVDEAVLKKFYLAVSQPADNIKSEDLEIDGNAIIILNHGQKKELKIDGIGFSENSFRFYPEANISSNILGFVGYVGDKQQGRYGLEEFFDQELTGAPGSIKIERDAKGYPIIINDREYNKADDGSDLILTINRSIQFTACQKLNEAVSRHGADGGSIIILEPATGAVLAMCSNPDYNGNDFQNVKNIKVFTNPAIFSQYEPGSIFKAITMSMALDQEKITPRTTYNDTGQVIISKYKIENSDRKANGVQSMAQVLEKSLNTGAIFAMRSIGPDLFSEYVKKFGFGEKTGIELEGESKGDIKNLIKKPVGELYATTASFGQGIAVTPIQMAAAFLALANNGIMMQPYIVKEIIKSDGAKIETKPKAVGRIISEKASAIIGGMLVNVVENGHGKLAGVKGYYIAGKTGTAQVPAKNGGYQIGAHIGSFAGFAPANNPKFVMLVRIDQPRDVAWAESSAAPLFGELAEYMLNYWQIPKERQSH
ncbi:penicillin-binding protein 2 [Patescibacteria group bacterium]|nr:penicillin-binding protein 2 [Patescibacteria group bacterium]MBU1663205.1 penicillin-binding protein 2 [Patescibacteria group bacterium]MBU1933763.1 penicillin-binding protein 2 [Patescibacteria group bacterium]MBU2007501.1 penicillin-binding protein 2 [Patescibacteria group bacterium]MBU2233766.1 penicillin-binding protein 2 [Patescibacteria group bacterium]